MDGKRHEICEKKKQIYEKKNKKNKIQIKLIVLLYNKNKQGRFFYFSHF